MSTNSIYVNSVPIYIAWFRFIPVTHTVTSYFLVDSVQRALPIYYSRKHFFQLVQESIFPFLLYCVE